MSVKKINKILSHTYICISLFVTFLSHIKLFFNFSISEPIENTAFLFQSKKVHKKREYVDISTFSRFFLEATPGFVFLYLLISIIVQNHCKINVFIFLSFIINYNYL